MRSIFDRFWHTRSLHVVTLAALACCCLTSCSKIKKIDGAVKSGDMEGAKALLKNYPELVSCKDKDGWTPLEYAAAFGRADMVKLLLDQGADVNSKDTSCGRTPLHYAWNAPVAELLLSHNAEVDAKAKDGETPLFMEIDFGHKDVAELLLAHGADVNARVRGGETPLYATQDAATAKLLLAHGADAKVKDNFGDTPLHVSCVKAMAEFLLANHVDVNATNENGETPLHTSAGSGLADVVEVLLAHGANVNAKDNQGFTPLHYAAKQGYQDVVELLLARGADLNAKDNKGETPLFLAESLAKINWASEKEAEWLRQHGAHE